ncbi:MAG: hypothetical protein Q7S13_04280 [Candidatus Omnitrophota bacterium]|nr:hypothetical protein [Candidatus Omnitrophota bacterium]
MVETLDIQKILPQSYPFLMIDRIESFEKGKSLTAIKNITGNEWVFAPTTQHIQEEEKCCGRDSALAGSEGQGYPDAETPSSDKNLKAFQSGLRPTNVFPETLLIEAAAQAGLILHFLSKINDLNVNIKYFLGKIDGKFLSNAFCGDTIKIKVMAEKMLDEGGVSMTKISSDIDIAEIRIIYKVLRGN